MPLLWDGLKPGLGTMTQHGIPRLRFGIITTGVGEVFGRSLSRPGPLDCFNPGVFRSEAWKSFHARRTTSRNNDLIFVGLTSENLTLKDIPKHQGICFSTASNSGPHKGDLAIVNVRPEVGESKEYLASPSTSPF